MPALLWFDCVYLFMAPGLVWQSSLKINQSATELFTDINTHMFIEKELRRNYSSPTDFLKQTTSNSPNLMRKRSKHIIDLDCNNLYGAHGRVSCLYGDLNGFQ
ncbi:hypothetical protein AVEN_171497-1 [Araneus ventricosus]|uniref:DNA-directed DNA polymerase n=1 Tax=Araneus ventricosus TaxID=182803 RepID=A0A4Y2HB30_ARAVE|nr:hypothetical protein AVEN_171497-1 [Araneus ventricosus]